MERLGFLLYGIGLIGYFINRRNYLFMLLALELKLLGIAYLLLFKGYYLHDIVLINYTLFVVILAGVETAVGLTLFILFYKIRNTINF